MGGYCASQGTAVFLPIHKYALFTSTSGDSQLSLMQLTTLICLWFVIRLELFEENIA